MNPQPKPTPRLLTKRQAQADVRAEDRRENAKVKVRSGGQCEVLEFDGRDVWEGGIPVVYRKRCRRRASQTHHLIAGIGRRNVGKSIKAEHKLHVCEIHHSELHGHVLKPENEANRYDAGKIRFTRVR